VGVRRLKAKPDGRYLSGIRRRALQLGHLPALPANFEGIFSRFPHEQANRINSSFGKNHQSFKDLASFLWSEGDYLPKYSYWKT
jgi:hypothetical protein